MDVQAQWFETRYGAKGFVPDGEPVNLTARETPKLLFVTLPSGAVERVRKFNSIGNVRQRETFHMSQGGKLVLTWDPTIFRSNKQRPDVLTVCSSEECQRREKLRQSGSRKGETPEQHWQRIRDSQPPFFWNGIQARRSVKMSDEELASAIVACGGDVERLAALVRCGGVREVISSRCEWCNSAMI